MSYNAPDRIVTPIGNAANIRAVYKALIELWEIGWIDRIPMLTGVRAGCQLLMRLRIPLIIFPETNPETIATVIRIGNPVNGKKVLVAIYKTGVYSAYVTDDEIFVTQKLLGRKEGVGVEPASAASYYRRKKLREMGVIDK